MSTRAHLESLADAVLGGGEEHEHGEADGTSATLRDVSGMEELDAHDMRRVGSMRGMDPALLQGKYRGKTSSRAEIEEAQGRRRRSTSKTGARAAAKLEQMQAAALDLDAAGVSDSSDDEEPGKAAAASAAGGAGLAGAASEVTDELVFLQGQQKAAMQAMSRSSTASAAQGKAAKSQVALSDALLEGRIHLQSALAAAARLSSAVATARGAVAGLLGDLLELQSLLLPRVGVVAQAVATQQSVAPAALAGASTAAVQAGEPDEQAERRLFPAALQESLAESQAKRPRRDACTPPPSHLDDAWRVLDASWNAASPFMGAVHNAAQESALLGGGAKRGSKRSRSVLHASLTQQVEGVMSDPARVARQAHPSEYAQGLRAPLCMAQAASGLNAPESERAEATQAWREGIYDDGTFYQALLKDFVAAAATPAAGAKAGGETQQGGMALTAGRGDTDVTQLKAGYKRVVRDVDRRASKGRKVRYKVHPKLTGFMAPEPLAPSLVPGGDGERFTVNTDVLIRSLFQRQ
ncbi:AATF [Symbiodinium sp. KB8]|nr:AATF [Symbiodinium sp. KB8]